MAAAESKIPAGLVSNQAVLGDESYAFASSVCALGQEHLFESWPAPGDGDEDKRRLVAQLTSLDKKYPGGLAKYVSNAKKLLEQSRVGTNPFEGFTPAVPSGERLSYATPEFDAMEAAGLAAAAHAGFVLVAGGLGERLGYNGIKVALPSEITTGRCYLGMYCDYILALQQRARAAAPSAAEAEAITLPLFIMTSGDTDAQTKELLASNNNFGMADGQIRVVKQEKVPAIQDNSGRFAISSDDPYQLQTKPHGHGDVHMLLHMSGTASEWCDQGVEWLVFFQDTNGLVFRAVPAALGVSAKHGYTLNSLTVPRKPGEPVGAICELQRADNSSLTINVEYNQLDPLLRATTGDGDVSDASGFSPFPGNINVLLFHAPSYRDILNSSGGGVPEFVNPKYKDAEKTMFKKPTRLECMMQDIPRLFTAENKVGFTQIDRWISFSAVKNNPVDALAKFNKTGFAESASTGESDLYLYCRRVLNQIGVHVAVAAPKMDYVGIPTTTGARVILTPRFAATTAEIRSRFPTPDQVHISPTSSLVLDGSDITIKSMRLDGALRIHAVEGATVVIESLDERNAGWGLVPIAFDDETREEQYRIRGYVAGPRSAERVLTFDTPGRHVVGGNGGGDGASSKE